MNDTIDLRQYITLGLKWWWLVAIMTLVGGVTGYLTSSRQAPVYEAATTMMVGQSIQATDLSTSDLLLSERLARTYAEIAQQPVVLQAVVDRLSLRDSWQSLKSRLSITPVRDTQLLRITVEAGSPEEARVTADELAHQLILLSPTALQNRSQDQNRQFVQQRLAELQTKIETGQARLQALEADLDAPLSTEQVQELEQEINDLENLVAGWENNYTQLLIFVEGGQSPNYLAVIQPAQAGNHPIRPKTSQDTLLAAVVGLLLALGIVFLVEYLDDTLKSKDDLSQSLGLAPLGAISRIKGKDYPDKLIAVNDLFTPVGEAYRIIRSNIQFAAVDRPVQTLMITSPTPNEGKSITAANLGVVMAQAGLRTIIVDADMRRPVQHQIFQISVPGGLTDLLCSPEDEPTNYLRKSGVENLFVITCGALPPNPSELLGSQRMEQVLAGLSGLADVIICDSPPVLLVADAAVLSTRVDGVVLVTQAGSTRLGAARQAILNLEQAGANILGGVLNQVKSKRGGYYYYQGYHYYHTSPRSSNGQKARAVGDPATRPNLRKWRLPFLK